MPLIAVAAAVAAALALDLALGEPPRRAHPTVWIGRLVARLVVAASSRGWGRAAGVGIVLAVCAAVLGAIGALGAALAALGPWAWVAWAVAGAILLYAAISVRSMSEHVSAVTSRLDGGDIEGARHRLAAVVKRDTRDLGRPHILSALVETIAENMSDGIVAPIAYFALAGAPGAMVYRAVNTIDAMAGYRTRELAKIGWFGATCDTVLGYVPARLTACLIVAAAAVLRLDWRGSIAAVRQDRGATASANAGWPMAAMAGALGVRLEKAGHHVICAGGAEPSAGDVAAARRVMVTGSAILAAAIAAGAACLAASGAGAGWLHA
ncbi:MAG: cobalamin biosynthesis protein [Thaumarchaeota archaeon]|nr:cobalamin biosynthesis protein [Nitrososphaerota archaeon]MDD9808970.1 cobalamin biosynthesis protein [Nitrososphaerota archaeon]MDD9826702.1 cobalamin biosynthesis protein [Nitrososphaerota archaeon]MDD9842369.1 cobalamin biosynthesis protein [Nitrososphaerota archaeon]RNJ73711.1 MAG: cobalamin biosynthesis protein [Thaumarchaeota archaeon S14]